MASLKPFRVAIEWIDYAHGPGADDAQPLATRLVELPALGGSVSIVDPALVAEVLDVAGLYTSDSSVQDDDRLWFRLYPNKLEKRARKWLAENATKALDLARGGKAI